MRKICGIFIFFTLWFILSPNLSFCQSGDYTFPAHVVLSEEVTEQHKRYDRGLEIDARPDRFETRRSTHQTKRDTNASTNHITALSLDLTIAQATKPNQEPPQSDDTEEDLSDPFADEDDEGEVPPLKTISDPFEPLNRAFFHFNDKLYFWLLEPIARAYRFIFPQPARLGVRNFFDNIGFPIRFVNCLLQGKLEGAGYEMQRFLINSLFTFGLKDLATDHLGIKEYDEDFGQTLGFWGLGPGFYINWPILGPSSPTDTLGIAGDIFLDPVSYVGETFVALPIRSLDVVNRTSLTIGEYEDLKRAALDPYVAMRDAYYQFRQNKIKE